VSIHFVWNKITLIFRQSTFQTGLGANILLKLNLTKTEQFHGLFMFLFLRELWVMLETNFMALKSAIIALSEQCSSTTKMLRFFLPMIQY